MLPSQPPKHRRRGATLIETTFVLGVCLLLLFAIFEYGRFLMLRHLLDNAAREGARQAVIGTNTLTTADIQNTVTNYLAGQPVSLTSFKVYLADANGNDTGAAWTSAAFGKPIAVDVAGSYNPMVPTMGFLPNPITLKAKVIMYSEAN
jgi:Flp pilus assembly protein TadG